MTTIIPPYEQALVGMGCITSEHKETKKKKKRRSRACMSLGQRKEGKNPRRLSSPGPGVPPLSPCVSLASHSRRLSSSRRLSPRHSSSSRPRRSRLLVPIILSLPFVIPMSPLLSSPRRPPMEHPVSSCSWWWGWVLGRLHHQ